MPSLLQAPKPTANPLSQGTATIQKSGVPFVISGLGTKATVPGGVNTSNTNTLPKSQTAPVSQQQVAAPVSFPTTNFNTAGSTSPSATTPNAQSTFNIANTPSPNSTGFNVGTGTTQSPLSMGTQVLNQGSGQNQTAPISSVGNQNTVASTGTSLVPPSAPPGYNQNTALTTPSGTTSGISSAPQLTQSGSTAALLAQASQNGSQQGQAITNNLATASAQGSPAATQYAAQTGNYGAGNIPIGQQAEGIANNYSGQIADVARLAAQGGIGMTTGGALNPIALGRAGAIESQAAQEQQALAAAGQLGLAGTSQALTGQNQAASASSAAGNIANTQQSNVQSGLANAGGLANTAQSNLQSGLQQSAALTQPSPTAYGQTSYNPATGQFSDGGGLPAGALQQYAQMAANGQYSAIPSSITSNIALSAQLNQAAKAINPNYNPITSTAQGAAQAQNTTTAGTVQTSTAATGYAQAVQTYQNMNTVYNTATGQATNLSNDLANTGINASNSQDYNAAINSLSSRLGSTGITKISTDIQELQNTYSNLLSTGGGTPTGQEQQALSILNPNSSAAQINQAIQSLQAAAYPKLLAQYQQAQQYQSALSSGDSSGSSGASSGWASLGD